MTDISSRARTVAGGLLATAALAALVVTGSVTPPSGATLLAVVAAYALLLATSGHVVRAALWFAGVRDIEEEDTGRAVGKVENVLVLTLVALDAYTALGL